MKTDPISLRNSLSLAQIQTVNMYRQRGKIESKATNKSFKGFKLPDKLLRSGHRERNITSLKFHLNYQWRDGPVGTGL